MFTRSKTKRHLVAEAAREAMDQAADSGAFATACAVGALIAFLLKR